MLCSLAMSHRRMADYWSKLAKQQGYPARSVFKLKEIDHRFHLLRPGARVLDLGCSPGSWSQFAAERVGPQGFVLGLDLQPLPWALPLPPHVTILRQDVLHWKPHASFNNSFDVLLSDMAPSTSGIGSVDAAASAELCEAALGLAQQVLKPNGSLVMKIFHGSSFAPLLRQVQQGFLSTKTIKPEATRGESIETFIVAQRKRFAPQQHQPKQAAQQQTTPGSPASEGQKASTVTAAPFATDASPAAPIVGRAAADADAASPLPAPRRR